MITSVAKLSPDDLDRHRLATAESNAVTVNPDAYSASETDTRMLKILRLEGELLEKYGVDSSQNWRMSAFTGDIWYEL